MEFRILGPLEVRADDGGACRFGSRKQRLVLAALLLNANQAVRAERLVDWLWEERAPDSAVQNLYSYVSDLRKRLGGEGASRLRTESAGYLLRVEPGEFDAATFEEMATKGREDAGEGRHADAADRFNRALGLWHADTVLEGLPLPDSLRTEAARLEELRTAVLEDDFEVRLMLGRHREILPDLETATRRHPLRERLWALRMLALYRSGRQADALETYQQVRKLLDTELGVEPGTALRQLQQQILAADPALDLARASGPTSSPESSSPVPVSAIPGTDASTETALSADLPRQPPPDRPAQLPSDLATFSGRGEEVERLLSLAARPSGDTPTTVVVSAIDGMAGVGKTSLAIHAAHQVAGRYEDGQLFIDLHGFTEGIPPTNPGDALDRLLRTLGVAGEQIPHDLDERAALWRTRVAGRKLLIVLDNAADEAQVRPLLPGTADCLVLVTSRRRLAGLDDAHPISLDVLPLSDAVTLFIRVAGEERLAGERDELLHEVVELCGRLPLALRVAASRLRHRTGWSLADLAERFRNQEDRLTELQAGHRSVAVALDVSYAQLDTDQQRMYRLLGLHPGSDVEPYAAAALADTTVRQAGRLLDDLLDVHLLRPDQPGRYRFHDLIRAHAAQTCTASDPEPVRRGALTRLLSFYTRATSDAVRVAYPYEFGQRPRAPEVPETSIAFATRQEAECWLDTELRNILALSTYAADTSPVHVLDISAALYWHLDSRAAFTARKTLSTQALNAARLIGDRRGEYQALLGLGSVHLTRADNESAADCYREALAAAREGGEQSEQCRALYGLGLAHYRQGSDRLAAAFLREAAATAEEAGDRATVRRAVNALGSVYLRQGEHELAISSYQEAATISRELRSPLGEGSALCSLARVHLLQKRFDSAYRLNVRALAIARETKHNRGEVIALYGLGWSHLALARSGPAAECFEQALAGALEIGHRNCQFEALLGLGRSVAVDLGLGYGQQALDLAVELGQPNEEARAHNGLGQTFRALGRDDLASEHWRRALAILSELGVAQEEETSVAEIRERLTELAGADSGTGR